VITLSNRKNVTLRVSEHPQSHIINQWLDEQKNIQESLTNIVMHMIERFGIRNITDYDIQKLLYQDPTASSYVDGCVSPIPSVQEKTETKDKVLVNEPTTEEKNDNEPKIEKEDKEIKEEQEDDLYSDLDVTTL
jgi:hypothetical protein